MTAENPLFAELHQLWTAYHKASGAAAEAMEPTASDLMNQASELVMHLMNGQEAEFHERLNRFHTDGIGKLHPMPEPDERAEFAASPSDASAEAF